jgi:hypothetical protein
VDPVGNNNEFNLDDLELKTILGDMPITEPQILKFVRGMLEEGIQSLAPQTVN